MTHVPHVAAVPTFPSERTGEVEVAIPGLTVSSVVDAGVAYLFVSSRGPGEPLTLLLPTGLGQVSGLAAFSRLGRIHARHWALVWGQADPPPTGVCFSTGDLRFRRERLSPVVRVGPVWVAVADGAFREATLDPDGPAPRWLALAPSW